MNTKFKHFLSTVQYADPSLVEAINSGYATIYEGTLGKTLATAGLALGMMGGAAPAHANFFSHKNDPTTEIQAPLTVDQIKDTTASYLQEISDYFIDTNDFMNSPGIKKLADYINTLPEKMKSVAQSEISTYRHRFGLGTPTNNIQRALAKYAIDIR